MGKRFLNLKKVSALLLTVAVMLSCIICIGVFAADGTAIGSAEELLTLMNTPSMWSDSYYLTADIDLSDYAGDLKQAPIGSSQTAAFKGSFDGNGFTVSGLDFSAYTARTARIGLFGAANGAMIKNLTVEGAVSSSG